MTPQQRRQQKQRRLEERIKWLESLLESTDAAVHPVLHDRIVQELARLKR